MMRQYIVMLRGRESRFTTKRSSRPMIRGGLSQDSLASHFVALRRFWNWCNQEYKLSHNLMTNIRPPPSPQAQPKGISLQAVAALMKATGTDEAGARDRAMMAFLIDTGCRSQGLLQLEPSSLDLEERRAIVIEKGRPPHPLFLSEFTVDLLKAWIEVRPPNTTTVFCSFHPCTTGSHYLTEG